MNERQTTILELVREKPGIKVGELAEHFGVSPMTIRRDLTNLASQGLLIRTHGGAIPPILAQPPALAPHPTAPKAAIGRLAATLVQRGQTVMVDTGTTALEVARHLPANWDLTVATTSLGVAEALYPSSIQVLVLGGLLKKGFPSLYGPLTESNLAALHVDILFIGCDGADSRAGFYTADVHLSSVEQAMIRSAERVVVVTESIKFGRRAFVRYATPDQVDMVVTDDHLSAEDRLNLEERGITVLIADT